MSVSAPGLPAVPAPAVSGPGPAWAAPMVYGLMVVVGAAAFLYPFWLPSEALPAEAHASDAPIVAGAVGGLVVAAVSLELRRRTMTGATVALLGVLSAIAGLLRLLDLPGGGSGIFFPVILAGAAFGSRFGLLLGLCSMAVSAVVTGGIGPWLPFQMLALGWMGAGAGWAGRLGRRVAPGLEVAGLAAYGWIWAFVYGAIMNLWFWPFAPGDGPLSWQPGSSLVETLGRYRSFYLTTSFGWDAAGAVMNVVLIAVTGRALLGAMRRVAGRLDPVVEMEAVAAPESSPPG